MRAIPPGCDSKHRYRGRKRALGAAASIGASAGHKLYAFHCPECHCWHLTSWAPEDQKRYLERAADRRPR